MARSREELAKIIASGQSVLLPSGVVITKVEELPSEIELAGDDIVRKQHALNSLKAQRDALDAAIAQSELAKEESPALPEEAPEEKPADKPKK